MGGAVLGKEGRKLLEDGLDEVRFECGHGAYSFRSGSVENSPNDGASVPALHHDALPIDGSSKSHEKQRAQLVSVTTVGLFRRLEEMITYMDLNEQVDADFTRARRRARLRAVAARIRREHTSNRLLSFDDLRSEHSVANNRLHRGTRVVEVDQIVGSVGRWGTSTDPSCPRGRAWGISGSASTGRSTAQKICRRSSSTRSGMPTSWWTATIESPWPATTTCQR